MQVSTLKNENENESQENDESATVKRSCLTYLKDQLNTYREEHDDGEMMENVLVKPQCNIDQILSQHFYQDHSISSQH